MDYCSSQKHPFFSHLISLRTMTVGNDYNVHNDQRISLFSTKTMLSGFSVYITIMSYFSSLSLFQGQRYCFVTSTEKKHGLSGPLKVTMVWLQLKKPSLTSSGKLLMLLPPLTVLLLLRIFRKANSGIIMKSLESGLGKSGY